MKDFSILWESLGNFFCNAFPPHFHTAAASILYQMLFCLHESNSLLIFFVTEILSTFPKCTGGPVRSISRFFKSCSFSIIRPSPRHYCYRHLYILCAPDTPFLVLLEFSAVLMCARCGYCRCETWIQCLFIWYLHLLGSLAASILLWKICRSGVR